MDLLLSGRTYVVTGGSSGVGLATVAALVTEGANVATCARDGDRLAAAVAEVAPGAGDRVFATSADVRSRDDVNALVAGTVDRFGALDGLVNNAGGSRMKPLWETGLDEWHDELDLKFAGVLNPVDAAREHLRASDAASIVNINAVLARQPETRLIATSAARAGLLNLSKSLSFDLAPEIRVNSVLLGLIDTGQWQRRYAASGDDRPFAEWERDIVSDRGVALRRFGRAEEVAAVVAMLLSPRSSYVTGSTVEVAGGVSRYV
ncbi:SDR family oxidoreductase [Gordonia neofelifaecis]|uniref:3-oxoacyl-[acyl-carrier-protein] reductase MabA n=1 Tax=Gordonia neofelifaecis NRRL B-59395 TaxID=644548 RepID=F1YK68_9ACTN|nr:SDR family oxidoreductase [Gordonia neofelifaecis]EGD54914.1 short chain dehydrogenase [Gordonia neofelifaecis NRRL B-59395]